MALQGFHMTDQCTVWPAMIQEEIAQAAPTEGGGFGSFFGVSQEPTPILIERKVLQDYRLHETRRMRSKEIHFFDHPMFGIIVKVTPYELPAPPEPITPTISSQPATN